MDENAEQRAEGLRERPEQEDPYGAGKSAQDPTVRSGEQPKSAQQVPASRPEPASEEGEEGPEPAA